MSIKKILLGKRVEFTEDKRLYSIDKSISDLLMRFNALQYKEEIIQEFKRTTFKIRLTFSEKIQAVTFYILRLNNFPVVLNDFSNGDHKSRVKILQSILKNHKYKQVNINYFKNLFKRIYLHMKERGGDVEECLLRETNKNFIELTILDLLKNEINTYLFIKYDLAKFTQFRTLVDIKKKYNLK